jgi:hypothetical protein
MLTQDVDDVLRQGKGPARRPGLRVTVFPYRPLHRDAGRHRRVAVRSAVEIDMGPRQRSRFLGADTGLQARHDVGTEPVNAQVTGHSEKGSRLLDGQRLRRSARLTPGVSTREDTFRP